MKLSKRTTSPHNDSFARETFQVHLFAKKFFRETGFIFLLQRLLPI